MSHSLHRYGSVDNLRNDFCIYSRAARGVNRENCGDKLRCILEIYLSEEVVNFGSSHSGKCYLAGLKPEEYASSLDNSYGIIATFADREAVLGVLKKMKEEGLGISVVVSGLIEEVKNIATEAGLTLHTALLSLGTYGKKNLLPEDEVLQIVTMCGHSLVSSGLVRSVFKKVRSGEMTAEEGALQLTRPCSCGIFNTVRCQELMTQATDSPRNEDSE
ncbi:MAG: hypothetical protein HKP41_18700 [Desulfobacterales bacterium]|nr:hypothetical protein [Deltaproteobacteria bacterium]NNK14837.1 hypothetical protein [Desulfofustis sp.]NNK96383.1 hypothetical protein [Desulfobacterales bacterium]